MPIHTLFTVGSLKVDAEDTPAPVSPGHRVTLTVWVWWGEETRLARVTVDGVEPASGPARPLDDRVAWGGRVLLAGIGEALTEAANTVPGRLDMRQAARTSAAAAVITASEWLTTQFDAYDGK